MSTMALQQQQQQEIIERWMAAATKAASARGLSRPELTNLMPRYLAAVAAGEPLPEVREHLERHLADRLRLGFDLAEMIEEFALMEHCIGAVLDALPQDQRAATERGRISSTLRGTIVAVGELYQEHMRLDEQREKRLVRRLDAIAYAGLHDPEAPLRARLREATDVVMEAMNADAAALLLYEPVTERLIMHAGTGTAEAELTRYATSLSLSSFAGQIAAREQPVFVSDAATTELEVSEPLRRSGIHSLLGVRLPQRLRLLGVVYVGLREQRRFTGREIGRLEMLGARLTLHLDNADLYAELRRRVDELGVEREIREQFVAILAHDLRGPLSTVRMSAQMLAKHPDRADRLELASRLMRNLDRIDGMIRDLLDVGRVRAGERLPLDLAPCDLRALAQEAAEELRAAHGDRFDLVADEAVQGIWSRDELRRALWNMGTNAVKYGAPDARITLRVERLGERARVSVHNAGNPIPAEDQGRIFDAFARSHGAPRTGNGWGLGLALVHACAEAHGGEVTVQSTPELGTTFSVTLPLDSRPHQREA